MAQAPYVKLEVLRATLDLTGSAHDDQLVFGLNMATRLINTETRRRFDQATTTRTFDGEGRIILPIDDCVSVSAVTMARVTGGTPVTLASSDYVLMPRRPEDGWPYTWLEVTDTGAYPEWYKGYGNIAVTGVWGWPEVPADIQATCLSLAARFWKAAKAGFSDVIGMDPATATPVFSKQLTTLDRRIFADYRRTRIY